MGRASRKKGKSPSKREAKESQITDAASQNGNFEKTEMNITYSTWSGAKRHRPTTPAAAKSKTLPTNDNNKNKTERSKRSKVDEAKVDLDLHGNQCNGDEVGETAGTMVTFSQGFEENNNYVSMEVSGHVSDTFPSDHEDGEVLNDMSSGSESAVSVSPRDATSPDDSPNETINKGSTSTSTSSASTGSSQSSSPDSDRSTALSNEQ